MTGGWLGRLWASHLLNLNFLGKSWGRDSLTKPQSNHHHLRREFNLQPNHPVQHRSELTYKNSYELFGHFGEDTSLTKSGSTISTLLHDRINPKDCQVLFLGDSGFLQFFRVVSRDYGTPRNHHHHLECRFGRHLHGLFHEFTLSIRPGCCRAMGSKPR